MDFFLVHPHWFVFIVCMAFLPRITMLLTQICFMSFAGPLFWVGWFLAPRVTVAILASWFYFHTNPVLCVFTWIWAFGGETAEKKSISHKE